MTLKAAHGIAQSNTPSGVEVPHTWTGIVVWAVGKFGIGIIGFIAIVPLYLDLKASNERFAKITEANIQAITDAATWQNVTILLPEDMTTNGQSGPRLFIRQKKP